MTQAFRMTKRLVASMAVAAALFSGPAVAQQEQAEESQQPSQTLEEARTTLESWVKVQQPAIKRDTGEVVSNPTIVQKMLLNDQNRPISSLAIQIDEGGEEKKLLIEVPIGMRLDSGLAVKVDDEKPVTLPYRVCQPSSCFAEMSVSDDFINKLKAGAELAVLVRPFPNGDVVGLPYSLQGFTAAYDGPVTDMEKIVTAFQTLEKALRESRDQDVQDLAEKRRQQLMQQRQQQQQQEGQGQQQAQ